VGFEETNRSIIKIGQNKKRIIGIDNAITQIPPINTEKKIFRTKTVRNKHAQLLFCDSSKGRPYSCIFYYLTYFNNITLN